MQEYNTLVEESAALLTDALWSRYRDSLQEAGSEMDGLLWALVLRIGRLTLEQLYARWALLFEETTDDRVERRDVGVFMTVLGLVSVTLPRLRTRGCRTQASPMAEVFDVRSAGKSKRVERALVDFGCEQSYQRAADRFSEHYGFDVGRTSLLRVVQRHGERADAFVARRLSEAAGSADGEAGTVFVQLDGSMVPCAEFKSAGYAGRTDLPRDARVRPREWREVRVGLAIEEGAIDATYVARMDAYEPVVEQLFGAAVLQNMGDETQIVCTADGGNGLKRSVMQRFENCAFVLDHAHLVQHLWLVANERDRSTAATWVDTTLTQLSAGETAVVDRMLRKELLRTRSSQPRHPDPAPELRKFIDYLEEHAESVNYDAYRDAEWFVGSGRVESAHRYIPQARLKIPGATWSAASINKMLAIRVIRANGWWDEFWDQTYGPKAAA